MSGNRLMYPLSNAVSDLFPCLASPDSPSPAVIALMRRRLFGDRCRQHYRGDRKQGMLRSVGVAKPPRRVDQASAEVAALAGSAFAQLVRNDRRTAAADWVCFCWVAEPWAARHRDGGPGVFDRACQSDCRDRSRRRNIPGSLTRFRSTNCCRRHISPN